MYRVKPCFITFPSTVLRVLADIQRSTYTYIGSFRFGGNEFLLKSMLRKMLFFTEPLIQIFKIHKKKQKIPFALINSDIYGDLPYKGISWG